MNINVIPYKGEKLKKPKQFSYSKPIFQYKDGKASYDKGEELEAYMKPYIPDDKLINAVKLTQILQRPLLIRGEPGCGKTRLAQAVAYELYGENYHQYYFEWHIKSTTKATDGLYQFDHLERLRDVNLKKEGVETERKKYREFGPLGKAFAVSSKEHPAILLIDEIDKANIDFPNDLLLELDQLRFDIKETGESIKAAYPPIIFITSNDEKELPAAFLRRCLFHYIDFPSDKKLQQIIRANFPDLSKVEPKVVKKALQRFKKLRAEIERDLSTDVKPATSKLLDWIKVMNYHFELKEAIAEIDMDKAPPYYQTLLTSLNDYKREVLKRESAHE